MRHALFRPHAAMQFAGYLAALADAGAFAEPAFLTVEGDRGFETYRGRGFVLVEEEEVEVVGFQRDDGRIFERPSGYVTPGDAVLAITEGEPPISALFDPRRKSFKVTAEAGGERLEIPVCRPLGFDPTTPHPIVGTLTFRPDAQAPAGLFPTFEPALPANAAP